MSFRYLIESECHYILAWRKCHYIYISIGHVTYEYEQKVMDLLHAKPFTTLEIENLL